MSEIGKMVLVTLVCLLCAIVELGAWAMAQFGGCFIPDSSMLNLILGLIMLGCAIRTVRHIFRQRSLNGRK